jgi:hypothetical protein
MFEYGYPFTHFTTVKHCFHTVLKVYNGFLPLVHLQPIKIVSLLFFGATESGAAMLTLLQHYNWPVKVESISQSFREFVLLCACKISSQHN